MWAYIGEVNDFTDFCVGHIDGDFERSSERRTTDLLQGFVQPDVNPGSNRFRQTRLPSKTGWICQHRKSKTAGNYQG